MAFGIWLLSWGIKTGYGPAIDSWFGIPVQDIYGASLKRWPLPILGAVLTGGWITGSDPVSDQTPATAWIQGADRIQLVLSLLSGMISFFRVDPAPMLVGDALGKLVFPYCAIDHCNLFHTYQER